MRFGTVAFSLLLFSAANLTRATEITSPDTNLAAREDQIVAASEAGNSPRFNGARIVGVYPNTPFLYSLAVTGKRPISYSARHLPRGLALESDTGIITGTIPKAGEYTFQARAKNSAGTASTDIVIEVGDKLALTPPMGWNSYDAYGDSVRESEVLANAEWLKQHLQPLGWNTVVIDFRWYDRLANGLRHQNPEGAQLMRLDAAFHRPTAFLPP